jgi:ABC-2 type transport system permease protein
VLFRSIFLKTLRDYRVAILGWGIGMGLVVISPMASVSALVTTPQAREQLVSLAATFAWNADAIAVDTIGGYATFKIGIFVFLIAIWPLLAGSRMLRGEEDRGSMDVLLSLPRPRLNVTLEKLAAMWTALFLMGVLIGLLAFAGGAKFGANFGLGGGLLYGLNLALICAVFGSLALLISQFTQERGPAAGTTAGLLVFFIVLDMVHRVVPNGEWISRLSPIYYYNLSKPLIPSYGVNFGAMAVQLALALILGGVAVWLFVRRDVGGTVPLPRWLRLPERHASMVLPVGDWSLRRIPGLRRPAARDEDVRLAVGLARFLDIDQEPRRRRRHRQRGLVERDVLLASAVPDGVRGDPGQRLVSRRAGRKARARPNDAPIADGGAARSVRRAGDGHDRHRRCDPARVGGGSRGGRAESR